MNVLVIEASGDGLLDLALRGQKEGHVVRYYLQAYNQGKRPVGRGMVTRVADWRNHMRWADVVLLGGNGKWMAEIDRWREIGVPIVGGSAESSTWELDRLKGMAVLKRAGIAIPPYHQCATYEEAIAYVLKRGEGMAVKPCGDVADKALSFVAKTPAAMVWRLQRWRKEGKKFPAGLMLQDRIEGIEMAVGAWFGPGGFVVGWEENFEEKRLFSGALGPNCGEAGTVMRLTRNSKLAEKVLKPAEEQLARIGYCGNVDVNCIIDKDGNPWPLEWTMRFGYPAINIELALHKEDPIEFLAALARGTKPAPRDMENVAVGIVMAIPPYPFGHERAEEVVNVPIWGLTPGLEETLHLCDVMAGDAPDIDGTVVRRERHLATAGSYVCVSAAAAETVTKARGRAHRALTRLSIPASPFWRNDIGTRLRAELPELQKHGFAVGAVYA